MTKDKLLAWWNGLEDLWRATEQKDEDTKATVQAQHNFGRDETVLPAISGHVKNRRGKKNKQ